jgi:hypothetical protein
VDHLIYDEMAENLKKDSYEILDICNYTLKIDTTNFDLIDYDQIYTIIETSLQDN